MVEHDPGSGGAASVDVGGGAGDDLGQPRQRDEVQRFGDHRPWHRIEAPAEQRVHGDVGHHEPGDAVAGDGAHDLDQRGLAHGRTVSHAALRPAERVSGFWYPIWPPEGPDRTQNEGVRGGDRGR